MLKSGTQSITVAAFILGIGTALWQGGQPSLLIPAFFALFFVFSTCICLGTVVLSWLTGSDETQKTESILFSIVAGILFLNSVLMLLAFTSPFSISINFWIVAGIVSLFIIRAKQRAAIKAVRISFVELGVLIIGLLAARFWSSENFQGIYALNATTMASHPWQDIFYHTNCVSTFLHSTGSKSLSSFFLAGTHLAPYHYATYMIPALIGALIRLPAYVMTTTLFPALGILCTGLSAYCLGRTIAGSNQEICGTLAAFSVLMIPDPSFYEMGNRWTSYFFFQEVGMAGSYGVAAIAVAWIFIFRALRSNTILGIIGALLFLFVSAVSKVQIATVYALPLLLFLTCFFGRYSKVKRIAALILIGMIYFCVVLLARSIPNAPTLAFSKHGAILNLQLIIDNFHGLAGSILHRLLPITSSYKRQLLIGAPLILVSTYGLWLPVTLLNLFLALRLENDQKQGRSQIFGVRHPFKSPLLWFPAFIIIAHLTIALTLSENHGIGDPFEIYHKTFVWPYFALCVWNGALISKLIVGSEVLTQKRILRNIFLITPIALFLIYRCGLTTQSGIQWPGTMDIQFSKGLYEIAQLLRTRSTPLSVVQQDENDNFTIVSALSERPAYVLHGLGNLGLPSEQEKNRWKTIADIYQSKSFPDLSKKAIAEKISWIITSPGKTYPWMKDTGAHSSLCSEDYCLYAVSE